MRYALTAAFVVLVSAVVLAAGGKKVLELDQAEGIPMRAERDIKVVYYLAECDQAQPPTPRYTGPGDTWGEVREWVNGRNVSMLLQTPQGRVMAEAYRLGNRETGWRTWTIRGPRCLYRWMLARPERCRIVQTYRDAWDSTDTLWRDWVASKVDTQGNRFVPPILYGGDDENDERDYLLQED